jgi:hypothetical protein
VCSTYTRSILSILYGFYEDLFQSSASHKSLLCWTSFNQVIMGFYRACFKVVLNNAQNQCWVGIEVMVRYQLGHAPLYGVP